ASSRTGFPPASRPCCRVSAFHAAAHHVSLCRLSLADGAGLSGLLDHLCPQDHAVFLIFDRHDGNAVIPAPIVNPHWRLAIHAEGSSLVACKDGSLSLFEDLQELTCLQAVLGKSYGEIRVIAPVASNACRLKTAEIKLD